MPRLGESLQKGRGRDARKAAGARLDQTKMAKYNLSTDERDDHEGLP
jgi:hypothetical protein